MQRVHIASAPPTTLMTGNTTQAVLDAVDLLRGSDPDHATIARARLGRMVRAILCFAAGYAAAALLYAWIGFWSLAAPLIVGIASAVLRTKD